MLDVFFLVRSVISDIAVFILLWALVVIIITAIWWIVPFCNREYFLAGRWIIGFCFLVFLILRGNIIINR